MNEPTVPLQGRALFGHPLAGAVMAVLRERGWSAASVEEFCERAGIGAADLPEPLRSKGLLALAVSEAYVDDLEENVGAAFVAEERWPDSLRAAAYEAARWILRYPDVAWWGTVGVLEAGEVARSRRDGVFRWCAALIDAGRKVAPNPAAVPSGASLIAIGAIVETLGRIVQGTIEADPVEAVPRLMYAAVRPYLGEEAARRELKIPPPPDLAGPRDPERRD